MNADAKKAALRAIPYGLYVLTADGGDGNIAAATVNWVTQASFAPPLVAVGVKGDSHARSAIGAAGFFALNVLGKDQGGVAYAFFKPTVVGEGTLSGQAYTAGSTGAPILSDAYCAIECKVTTIVEEGDHHLVIGEVVEAQVFKPATGRPDAATLELKDLGDNVFYGG
jgi:flavin reductase (DIM6/NTAB) family NADH-FMN oxidoreductase RutF